MKKTARATLFAATLLATSFGISSVAAAALTIDDVAGLFSSYLIISIEPVASDPSVYEVVYENDGIAYVAYVDSDTGEFLSAEQVAEGGGGEPAEAPVEVADVTPAGEKDDCKNGGWEELGFRNQGQCIANYNTGR